MKSSKSILMLLLILSLNVLLNSSCKKYKQEEHYNQVIEFNDFPKEINIKGHQTGPKKFFLEPMKIGKLDSILYILDYKKKNKLFLYNLTYFHL